MIYARSLRARRNPDSARTSVDHLLAAPAFPRIGVESNVSLSLHPTSPSFFLAIIYRWTHARSRDRFVISDRHYRETARAFFSPGPSVPPFFRAPSMQLRCVVPHGHMRNYAQIGSRAHVVGIHVCASRRRWRVSEPLISCSIQHTRYGPCQFCSVRE